MTQENFDFDFGTFRIDVTINADKEDPMLEEGTSAVIFMREEVHDEKAPEEAKNYHPVNGWVVVDEKVARGIAEHMKTVQDNHYEILEKEEQE